MRDSLVNRLPFLFWSLLFAWLLAGCGTFEVGIERTSTPAAPTPTLIPTVFVSPVPTRVSGMLKPGQTVRIIKISMLNRATGWAVGQVETDLTDHILFTGDGGQTWQERTPAQIFANQPPEGLSAAAFFDKLGNAWVSYSSQQAGLSAQGVWRSTDQGTSWQLGQPFDLTGVSAEIFALDQMGFLDAQYGWALAHLGAGMSHDYIAIYTTQDAGQTWQRVVDPEKNPDLMACPKSGLAFSSAARGWLTGDCPGLMESLFLFSSVDGGQSWQRAALDAPAGQPADFLSQGNPVCGIPGLVYSTARATLFDVRCQLGDAQKTVTWLYVGLGNNPPEARKLPLPFGSLDFISQDEGWLVGSEQNDLAAPGAIYHTTDGGQTWKLMTETAWQGRADFVDSETGWVIAQSAQKLALVKTINGGTTWEALTPRIVP